MKVQDTMKRILIVEDNADLAFGLRNSLEIASYEVVVANDGPSGLRDARTVSPDLIILDLMLPRIDGWRFLTIIADETDLSGIPVVVCTGAADAHPPGVPRDHILQKPIKTDILMDFVARYCGPGMAYSPPPGGGGRKKTTAKRRRSP